MPPAWPETIVCGQGRESLENGQKTGLPQGEIAKGFGPPFETGQRGASRGSLRPRIHARPANHSVADPRLAGVCGEARLDHRRAVKEVGTGASQRELRE